MSVKRKQKKELTVRQKLDFIDSHHSLLRMRRQDLQDKIDKIESEGYVYGSVHEKFYEKKDLTKSPYAFLLPFGGGKRVYLGQDQDLIEREKARCERGQRHKVLLSQLKKINSDISAFESHVDNFYLFYR